MNKEKLEKLRDECNQLKDEKLIQLIDILLEKPEKEEKEEENNG